MATAKKKKARWGGKRPKTISGVSWLTSKNVDFEKLAKDLTSGETLDEWRKNLPRTRRPFPKNLISASDAERLLKAPLITFCDGGGETYFARVRSVETGRSHHANISIRVLPDGLLMEIAPDQVTHILSTDSFGDISAPVEQEDLVASSRSSSAVGQMPQITDAQRGGDAPPLVTPPTYSAYLMMWVNTIGRVERVHITSEDSLCIERNGDGSIPVTLMEVRAASYHVAQEALSHIWRFQLQTYLDPDRKFNL